MRREYYFADDFVQSRIDPNSGTILGVSLISKGEAKGHGCWIDDKTLDQVLMLAQRAGSVKVKANHGSGVLDTVGFVDNFRRFGEKILADLHIYKSEPERNRIFEIAQTNPSHLGISLEFSGQDEIKDGNCLARADELYTAALVSDPAANKSLFSANTVDTKQKIMADNNSMSPNGAPPKAGNNGTNGDVDPVQGLCKRLDEMERRLAQYENPTTDLDPDKMSGADQTQGATIPSDPDDAGTEGSEPPITDPSIQPKKQNDKIQMSEMDDDENLDPEDPEGGDDVDNKRVEKKMGDKLKRVAEMAAKKAIREFAASLGDRNLRYGGGSSVQIPQKRSFDAMVSSRAKELGCRPAEAAAWVMQNHPEIYNEHKKNLLVRK